MSSVGISMHKGGEYRDFSKARHRRRARHEIGCLVKKFYDDAVIAPDILIHNQPDKMPLVEHFVHFADAAPISYVHTNQRAKFVDKFIRALRLLFFSDADERNAVLRESSAHKFPIIAVASHNDRAAFGRIFISRQMFKPDNFNVILHIIFELGEGKNFHKNFAALNGTFLSNPRRFFRRDVQTATNIIHGNIFTFGGKENPNKTCEPATKFQGKTQRQQTNNFA